MTEETKMKKFIEGGVVRYARVPLSLEDELKDKEKEIKRLHELIDTLRSKIETLEQEQQRQTLLDKEAGPVSSYDMYI
jgi:peptidoglycan hydrolase CwlO-like protein